MNKAGKLFISQVIENSVCLNNIFPFIRCILFQKGVAVGSTPPLTGLYFGGIFMNLTFSLYRPDLQSDRVT